MLYCVDSRNNSRGMKSKSLQDLPEASTSTAVPTRKRRMPRFSLRRLLYSNTFLARHLGSSQNSKRRTIITGMFIQYYVSSLNCVILNKLLVKLVFIIFKLYRV